MAGGQHHAFAHTKLHLARCQIGHHHRQLANQVFGLVHAGDATEHIAHASFAHIQRQAQQLDRAFDRFAVDDLCDAQVDFGEVVDGNRGRDLFAAGDDFFLNHGRRLEQGFELFEGDTLHQVLVSLDGVARAQQVLCFVKGERRHVQESLDLCGQCGQHRFELQAQQAEGFDAGGAGVVQTRFLAFLLGQFPRFVLVHIGIDLVGQQHDFAQGFGVFALFVKSGNGGCGALQGGQEFLAVGAHAAQFSVKSFGDETGRARGDVDELANQVRVHPRHEVFGIEVDVFVAGREFGRQVVAQPLGVHAQAEVLEWVQARTSAFAHLLAVVHRQEAVYVHLVGRLAA